MAGVAVQMSNVKFRAAMRRKKIMLYFHLGFDKCYWCGSPMKYTKATIEHVIPRSLGGGNAIDNLALSCWRCNQKRGNYIRGAKSEPLDGPLRELVDAKMRIIP